MGKILAPFLAELESSDGVHTIINEKPVLLHASIACVCADGLAAHQLFGFRGPAASHFCCLCMVDREQFLSGAPMNPVPRTKELYNKHVG